MRLIVPSFPFSPLEAEAARETFDSLAGIADQVGTDVAGWSDELGDPDFCAAVASYWALLSGREPERGIKEMLRDAISVTEEQLRMRLELGTAVTFP